MVIYPRREREGGRERGERETQREGGGREREKERGGRERREFSSSSSCLKGQDKPGARSQEIIPDFLYGFRGQILGSSFIASLGVLAENLLSQTSTCQLKCQV